MIYEMGNQTPIAKTEKPYRPNRVVKVFRLFLIRNGLMHSSKTIEELQCLSGRLRDDVNRMIDSVCPHGVGSDVLEVRDGNIGMRKYYGDNQRDVYVIGPDRDKAG